VVGFVMMTLASVTATVAPSTEESQLTLILLLEHHPRSGAVRSACIANQILIQKPYLPHLLVIPAMKNSTDLMDGAKVRPQTNSALASLMDFMDLPARKE